MKRLAIKGRRRSLLVVIAFFCVGVLSCSETSVNVIDDTGIPPGDSTLPDGFVATNRPPDPPLSFQVPCPLGIVPDGTDNPAVTLGCPFPECIPAIDKPKFGTVKEIDPQLTGADRIMVVERDGQVRGFPIRILIHHEIVNQCWNFSDGSQKYSMVSYCPIVDVGMHFKRDFVCGSRESYGVSSGIYNGNLIVYQRGTAGDTDGSFVQMYGGGLNNDCLEIERTNIDMRWAMFSKLYPNALVLSQDTGNVPEGGYDLFDHPYREFWSSPDLCVNGLCFPVTSIDPRLPLKRLVYGVFTPGETKAYDLIGLMGRRVVNDVVGGKKTVVWGENGTVVAFEAVVDGEELTFSFLDHEGNGLPLYEDDQTESLWTFDGIAVFGPLKGKRLPQMIGYRSFWFAWSAFFPETLLYNFGS